MMAQEAFMNKVNEITAANNAASQASANAMMKFQAEMSNTAHQREVEDLIKAGLNPMLSVNAGASTPQGAMAQTDMSGASALAQWNSASAALQGALANAGAIIRSAEIQQQTAANYPNSWAGIANRFLKDTGIWNQVAGSGLFKSDTLASLVNKGKIDLKSLLQDALRGTSIVTGNLGLYRTYETLMSLDRSSLSKVYNWLSGHWHNYIKDYQYVKQNML